MLKKVNRLSQAKKLTDTKTLNTQFAVIKISNGNDTDDKFGFIVSKKVDQRAVVRNKIKRRIRSAVEKLLPEITARREFLFILKREAIGIKPEEFYKTLKTILGKENLLK